MSAPADHPQRTDRPDAKPETIDEILRPAERRRGLRRLPVLVRHAFALVWASSPRELVTAGLLQLLAGISLAAQLFVMKRVLDQVVVVDAVPDFGVLAPELLLFGALLVVVALAGVAQREQQRTLGEMVQKYTIGLVMDVSANVDLIEYDRPHFHDRLQRARVNASVRPLQIASGVIGFISNGVAVVAVGVALFLLEPVVLALIVVGGIPSVVLNRLSSRILYAFEVRQTPGDRRRHYLYQILTRKEEAHEIRAFDSSDLLRGEHDRLFDERIVDLKATVHRRLRYGAVAGVVAATVTVGSIVLLLTFVRGGRLSMSDAAVAIVAVVLLAGRIRGLAGSTAALYEGAIFLEDFTDFVALEQNQSMRHSSTAGNNAAPISPFMSIELDRVGFTYPSRVEPSLHDISLSIRHGEVVAIVGENGSGKTTLIKLLAGLYRPSEGTIRWDGRDVAEVDLADLRPHVAVIFQDYARYFLTAHENIAIGRVNHMADADLVRLSAQRAGADGFISTLAAGYDTLLGHSFVGGSDLSTGQWQRIALARAYFRDAPMLILDEPTAALDPRGEYEIFQQVRRLAEGHTVVLVSHRFSSVRAADRILVLEDGRIIEEGDHETLLARDGRYAELFGLQAEGYRGAIG